MRRHCPSVAPSLGFSTKRAEGRRRQLGLGLFWHKMLHAACLRPLTACMMALLPCNVDTSSASWQEALAKSCLLRPVPWRSAAMKPTVQRPAHNMSATGTVQSSGTGMPTA